VGSVCWKCGGPGDNGDDTRVLLCMSEAVEGRLCLQEVMELMRKMMGSVLLCMMEAVEGGLGVGTCWTCRR